MLRAAEAAREGNAQYFLDLNSDDLQSLCPQKDEDGRSLLHSACVGGNLQLIELLIKRCDGSVINATDAEQWTPLMSAVSCGNEKVVQLLLSLGADVAAANKQGCTALHYASSKGRVPIIKLLLQSGASPTVKDCTGSLPLHRAAAAGRTEALREFLDRTPKHMINAKDASGATPLLLAANGGHQAAAILLAGRGADVEAEDKEGETPLGAAAVHGQLREALIALATGEKSLDDFEHPTV